MIVPRVFKLRQRKRKNISIVLSSQKTQAFACVFYWKNSNIKILLTG